MYQLEENTYLFIRIQANLITSIPHEIIRKSMVFRRFQLE